MNYLTNQSACLLLFCILIVQNGFAQKPYKDKLEGLLTQNDVYIDDCHLESVTLGYRVGTTLGEPYVYLNLKWKGLSVSDDCLTDKKFVVFLNIGGGGYSFWLRAGGSADMVVGPGDNKWGTNPLAGSPNWNEVITKNVDYNRKSLEYVSAEDAKALWKRGFGVVGAKLVTPSGVIVPF